MRQERGASPAAAAAADDLEEADDSRDELLDLLGSFDIADAWLPSVSSSPLSPGHTSVSSSSL